jgi:long-chain acyl-CoA synthetase
MKDYSDWEPILDYENESPYLENSNRPWLKFRVDNIPKSIKFDPIPVHEFIKLSAKKYPNNVCVYFKPKDKTYMYRDLVYFADKIAHALYDSGITKGQAVGIMTGNCPEFLFCCLGIMETGAAVVPINPLLKEGEVIHIIKDAGNIKTVFVHKNNFRIIKKVIREVKLDNIVLLGSEEAKEGTITLEEFIEDIAPKAPEVEIDPNEDTAALLYTGGTTGLPKGVMLTHNNLVSNSLCTLYMAGEREEDEEQFGKQVNLSVIPLCHSFGFQVLIIASFGVAMLVMFESFNPSEILEAIEYYGVENYVGVPVMFQMLINSPDFTERDLSSLTEANSGSAALAPELNNKWEEVTGFKVGQGYGLTETSPITHLAAKWMPEIIPESIGVPLIDTDAKIVNPDTLEDLPIGEIGELLIKGPQVMKGYWNNLEETKKTLIGGGWLRTGDLARMDERGYFYIEGRSKDMLKYKGYKVLPREVEEKLYEHPAVLEAGVVSAPDPNIGETIKAYIALKPEYRDGKISEKDIIEWAKERMASYKYPRKVEFINVLPRTAVGKVFRRKLREMAFKDATK